MSEDEKKPQMLLKHTIRRQRLRNNSGLQMKLHLSKWRWLASEIH